MSFHSAALATAALLASNVALAALDPGALDKAPSEQAPARPALGPMPELDAAKLDALLREMADAQPPGPDARPALRRVWEILEQAAQAAAQDPQLQIEPPGPQWVGFLLWELRPDDHEPPEYAPARRYARRVMELARARGLREGLGAIADAARFAPAAEDFRPGAKRADPGLSTARGMTDVALVDFRDALAENDGPAAARAWEAALATARWYAWEPRVLNRISLDLTLGKLRDETIRALRTSRPAPATLDAMAAALSRQARFPTRSTAFRFDALSAPRDLWPLFATRNELRRELGEEQASAITRRRPALSLLTAGDPVAAYQSALQAALELNHVVRAEADLAPHLRDRARLPAFADRMRAANPFVAETAAAYQKALESFDEAELKLAALSTILAVERHRDRTGRLPASLDAIDPALFPLPPTDVLSGRPLFYRIVPESLRARYSREYVIYTPGVNGQDDRAHFGWSVHLAFKPDADVDGDLNPPPDWVAPHGEGVRLPESALSVRGSGSGLSREPSSTPSFLPSVPPPPPRGLRVSDSLHPPRAQ